MFSRLLPEQRVHAPPAANTRIHAVGVEPLHKRDYILGGHRVMAHRIRVEASPTTHLVAPYEPVQMPGVLINRWLTRPPVSSQ